MSQITIMTETLLLLLYMCTIKNIEKKSAIPIIDFNGILIVHSLTGILKNRYCFEMIYTYLKQSLKQTNLHQVNIR